MPHVVLNGNVYVERLFSILERLFIRIGDRILKTMDIFLEKSKTSFLVECLIIDSGLKTNFLVIISARDDGVVVRLYPKVDIEKTDSVKQMLAEIAKQLMRSLPELKVGETNLKDYFR